MTKTYRRLLRFLGPFVRGYSRLEVRGREHLPPEGEGTLLVANHAGSIWWDAFCLAAALDPRPMNFVANAWDFNWALGPFLRKVGALPQALDGTPIEPHDPIVQQLKQGSLVGHFPEQAYHTFWQRNCVFAFAQQSIRYAELAGVPLVPTAIVGPEKAAATLFGPKRSGWPLHIPLVPPVVLPLKVTIEFGAPVTAQELLAEVGFSDDSGPCSPKYKEAASRLRNRVAELLAKYHPVRVSDEEYLNRSGWW